MTNHNISEANICLWGGSSTTNPDQETEFKLVISSSHVGGSVGSCICSILSRGETSSNYHMLAHCTECISVAVPSHAGRHIMFCIKKCSNCPKLERKSTEDAHGVRRMRISLHVQSGIA